MKIIIIDDDRLNQRILEEWLLKLGHEVFKASTGAEGYTIISNNRSIDVAITDWFIKDMDGLDLCRQIKNCRDEHYFPIILFTSKVMKKDLIEGLNAGADAFLTKPLDFAELKAHINVIERVKHLERKLEKQVRILKHTNHRIQNDLKAAQNIQNALLPHEALHCAEVNVGWYFKASEMVAGDMFNIFRLDENKVGMYILDVSGHGVSAALLSVNLSRVLTPHPQQGGILKKVISAHPYYEIRTPAEVVYEMNRLFPVMNQTGQYFTFMYGILDIQSGIFRYSRAGHLGPIHITNDDIKYYLDCEGMPLGIMDEIIYQEKEIKINKSDKILFITDGVNEARNSKDEEFDFKRLFETLKKCHSKNINDTIKNVVTDLDHFLDKTSPKDDITLVGFEFLNNNSH